jgi:hypothetical protein
MRFFICLVVFLAFSLTAVAEKPHGTEMKTKVSEQTKERMVSQIDRTISHLMRKAPARKINVDEEYRREVAQDVVDVAIEYGIPIHLFNVVIFQESSFRMDALGMKEEQGLGQVMDPHKYGCDMSTRVGQLECSAAYLQRGYKKCGNWMGALSHYQSRTGSCVPQKGSRHERMVTFRMSRWIKLRRKYPFPVDKNI